VSIEPANITIRPDRDESSSARKPNGDARSRSEKDYWTGRRSGVEDDCKRGPEIKKSRGIARGLSRRKGGDA